jgi:hypothetical protein
VISELRPTEAVITELPYFIQPRLRSIKDFATDRYLSVGYNDTVIKPVKYGSMNVEEVAEAPKP